MSRRTLAIGALAASLLVPGLTAGAETSGSGSKPRQAAEVGYSFENTSPAYTAGTGPKVQIHRYVSPYVQRGALVPLETLLETDGFQVDWLDKPLSAEILEGTDVLIVANAYANTGPNDYKKFSTLDVPSVYSEEEIALIIDWIKGGGSLLILADHSPFAGGTIRLAEALGFTYMTGVAIHNSSLSSRVYSRIEFRREGEGKQVGRLLSHPIVDGKLGRKKIDHFLTFEGQAIIPPPEASSLLIIPQDFETVLTFAIRRDFYSAPRMDASGLSQGAVQEIGQGRLAVFGETGGFTSQSQEGREPFGFSDPRADENAEFVLSTLRWLARFDPEK